MLHHLILLLICVAILAGAFILNSDPNGVYLFGINLPVHCPLHQVANINCSLCGLTRSLCMFAHGNFLQSFQLHKIGPAIFIFLGLQIPYRLWSMSIYPKPNFKLEKLNAIIFMILCAAVIVNWLIYLGGFIR